jgi:hypothetical protein
MSTSDFDLLVASHLSGDVAMARLLSRPREDRAAAQFHEHQHFEPADQAEHERGNNGEMVPDYCANCNRPFHDHNNGRCPK